MPHFNITAELDAREQMLFGCHVSCGANDGYFLVAGKTVAAVYRHLATAFNIPRAGWPLVTGALVDFSYRPRPGDCLEFVKLFGQKGGSASDEPFPLNGDVLTLAEAAALIPGRTPGKRVYVNTVWRWCRKGVRGVRLQSVLIGGQRCTTR